MKHRATSRGFTMVELMVVLAIMMLLVSVVLARYRTFETNAAFVNVSENIVLALRQAQVYGVGTKGTGASFAYAYGVHFSTASPHEMKIFADTNGDRAYTAGEEIETISWNPAISITSLTCNGLPCFNVLDITFKRPNPDAMIVDATLVPNDSGTITITDNNTTKTATVTITSAGQMSIQ